MKIYILNFKFQFQLPDILITETVSREIDLHNQIVSRVGIMIKVKPFQITSVLV